jgi:hypothetical protein
VMRLLCCCSVLCQGNSSLLVQVSFSLVDCGFCETRSTVPQYRQRFSTTKKTPVQNEYDLPPHDPWHDPPRSRIVRQCTNQTVQRNGVVSCRVTIYGFATYIIPGGFSVPVVTSANHHQFQQPHSGRTALDGGSVRILLTRCVDGALVCWRNSLWNEPCVVVL